MRDRVKGAGTGEEGVGSMGIFRAGVIPKFVVFCCRYEK